MKKIILIILMGWFVVCDITYADTEQENVYLTQILNALNAIQPLIIAAEKQQPQNTRIEFHYTKYQDSQGQWHNGLLEDVKAIQTGIKEQLNSVSVEPRTVMPLKGDYLDDADPKSNEKTS